VGQETIVFVFGLDRQATIPEYFKMALKIGRVVTSATSLRIEFQTSGSYYVHAIFWISFDTVGWVIEGHLDRKNARQRHLSSMVLFWNKWRKKTDGGRLVHVHAANGRR